MGCMQSLKVTQSGKCISAGELKMQQLDVQNSNIAMPTSSLVMDLPSTAVQSIHLPECKTPGPVPSDCFRWSESKHKGEQERKM